MGYSPTLGRWMQADPAGYADGANLFEYLGDNPASAVDPLGLYAEAPPVEAVGGWSGWYTIASTIVSTTKVHKQFKQMTLSTTYPEVPCYRIIEESNPVVTERSTKPGEMTKFSLPGIPSKAPEGYEAADGYDHEFQYIVTLYITFKDVVRIEETVVEVTYEKISPPFDRITKRIRKSVKVLTEGTTEITTDSYYQHRFRRSN
jgi:hypothetical protein